MNPYAILGGLASLGVSFGLGFAASTHWHSGDLDKARAEWTANALDDYRRAVSAAQKRIAVADQARKEADATRLANDRDRAARGELVRSVRDAAAGHVPAESLAACDARARKLADLFVEGAGLLDEGAGRVESRTREVNALYSGWPR